MSIPLLLFDWCAFISVLYIIIPSGTTLREYARYNIHTSPLTMSNALRELRHNPCFMSPITVVGLLGIALVSLITMLLQFPGVLLGMLVAPLAARLQFMVEFIYPTSLGKWFHLFVMRWVMKSRKQHSDDKNSGFHSRTIETRIEVVPARVFVHPLPQFLDNLGYLVVCVPEQDTDEMPILVAQQPNAEKISVQQHKRKNDIVATLIDCGDADAVTRQIQLIAETHYKKKTIHVHSILSTHKHHDHTAGNQAFMQSLTGKDVKIVCGGAVEKVPGCNFPLADGDQIPLPKDGDNDMNELIEIEAVATPAHTRGSITYILRPKTTPCAAILFTGDTMFCGGGGVPFEADIDKSQEQKANRMNAYSLIKAGAAGYAVERCFAEILARTTPNEEDSITENKSDRILIMPGHEYSVELLSRQLSSRSENCKWKNFSPAVYFETVSQLYVAIHRASLPHSSGKLLHAPTTISRELLINPHLRSLQKRGELVITAIRHWHRHFARETVSDESLYSNKESANGRSYDSIKSVPSNVEQWNLDSSDISSSIFTTVFSADLDTIIQDLDAGSISTIAASQRLKEMKDKLKEPVVGRRPIPSTLPSERAIYRGLVGFVLLGSRPTAMTLSDSQAMKLPPPVVSDSDSILISKTRLTRVLKWLGLLDDSIEKKRFEAMIPLLWREAKEYEDKNCLSDFGRSKSNASNYDSVDIENDPGDNVELGSLKWIIYGAPCKKQSIFGQFCLPCTKQPAIPDSQHLAYKSGMKAHPGELVRHDIFSCALCRSAAGCPYIDEETDIMSNSDRPVLKRFSSTQSDADGDEPFVEISTLLKEA